MYRDSVTVGLYTSTPKQRTSRINFSNIREQKSRIKMEQQQESTTKTITREISSTSNASQSLEKSSVGGADVSYTGSMYTIRSTKSTPVQSSYSAMFKGQRGRNRSMGYSSIRLTSSSSLNSSFEDVPALLSSRNEEKQQLGVLNNRFVNYIEKVHKLEARNQYLEGQIAKLERNKVAFSRSGDLYESELINLRGEIELLTHQKAEVEIALHNCQQDLKKLEKQLGNVEEERDMLQLEANSLRKDVDSATLARVDLERKVETLQEELQLVKLTGDEDIKALSAQLASACQPDVPVEYQTTDLSVTLCELRNAYDQLVNARKVDVDVVYKEKIEELQSKIESSGKEVSLTKNETLEVKRQLNLTSIEVESLRTTNSNLEGQIADMERSHENELSGYRNKIREMETELGTMRNNMAQHMVDYNDLLNAKLSLSLEIETYRKLLEGEDGRLVVDTLNNVEDQSSTKTLTETQTVKVIQYNVEERRGSSSSSSSSSSSGSN